MVVLYERRHVVYQSPVLNLLRCYTTFNVNVIKWLTKHRSSNIICHFLDTKEARSWERSRLPDEKINWKGLINNYIFVYAHIARRGKSLVAQNFPAMVTLKSLKINPILTKNGFAYIHESLTDRKSVV